MTKFRIHYPVPGTDDEWAVKECEFTDTPAEVTASGLKIPPITAREWAEDLAYSLGDKRTDYKIVEIRP